MALSEDPGKGAGSGKGTGSDGKKQKTGKGKTGKTSAKSKKEEEEELDAGLDSFDDEEEEYMDEDQEGIDEWEREEEDIVEEEEPFPPLEPKKKGKAGGRQKSVMEDFDVGDTDFFERDFIDEEEEDDFDIDRSKTPPRKETGQRRLRPLNRNNNPVSGTARPKGDDDPTADDPNEPTRLK